MKKCLQRPLQKGDRIRFVFRNNTKQVTRSSALVVGELGDEGIVVMRCLQSLELLAMTRKQIATLMELPGSRIVRKKAANVSA